jgi:hypothetical protein
MKRTLLLVCLSIVSSFALGLWVARRSQPRIPVLPPSRVLSEVAVSTGEGAPGLSREQIAELQAQLDSLQDDTRRFVGSLESIQTRFRDQLRRVLTHDQFTMFLERSESLSPPPMQLIASDDPAPASAGPQIIVGPGPALPTTALSGKRESSAPGLGLPLEPLNALSAIVVVKWSLDELTRDLRLNSTQSEEVKHLLEQRRDEFLKLVDEQCPPSLRLLSSARRIQQATRP